MRMTELLGRYGVDWIDSGHTHCRPGWIQCDCMHCSPGWKHYRLGYNERYGYFSCWSCGYHPLLPTLQLLTGESYETLRGLEGRLELRSRTRDLPGHAGKLRLPYGVGPLQVAHVLYLSQRGFGPEVATVWGVRSTGMDSDLPWRLFIPITLNWEVVSWTTRRLTDREPRYQAARSDQEAVPHRDLLYGEDRAKHQVLVVEGPADVWAVGPGAVATFGTSWTRKQLLRLVRFPVRTICFDNEAEAQRQSRRLFDALAPFPGKTSHLQIDSKDPGSCKPRELRYLRQLAGQEG